MNNCFHVKKAIIIILKMTTESVPFHIGDLGISFWVILKEPFLISNFFFYQKVTFFKPKSCGMCTFLVYNFLLVIVILKTILVWIPFMFRSLFKFNFIITALKFTSSDIYHTFFDNCCLPFLSLFHVCTSPLNGQLSCSL
jgi:hypothetical protein